MTLSTYLCIIIIDELKTSPEMHKYKTPDCCKRNVDNERKIILVKHFFSECYSYNKKEQLGNSMILKSYTSNERKMRTRIIKKVYKSYVVEHYTNITKNNNVKPTNQTLNKFSLLPRGGIS